MILKKAILRHKLRTAITHAVYHSAEAMTPDVSVGTRFERRLHLMRNCLIFLTQCVCCRISNL